MIFAIKPNHRPYAPKEIELIKEFCKLSDKEDKKPKDSTQEKM